MSHEQRAKDYVTKKRAERRSSKEIICCLKRAIAREISILLTQQVAVPRIDDLRPLSHDRGISLQTAAEHFNVWPMKISTIERGKSRDDTFATTYRE